ncbi:MAG: LolA-related protein [Methylophilaceae bacterium]
MKLMLSSFFVHARSTLLMLSLACTAGMTSLSYAAEWDIDQLMRTLALTRSGHASFIEKKSIAILDKPVESSGELFYTAPDRLEKRTLKPKVENMLLDHGTLTIEQKGKKHVLQLQSYPEIAAFIDSIRGTLAGDRKALERTYKLSLEGDEQNWTLMLLPLDAKMKKVVERIRISGERNELRNIEINQADGDSSLMTIVQLPPA